MTQHHDPDSPKRARHETPSKFQERANEVMSNHAAVIATLFFVHIVLTMGSFIYSYALNQKMDYSNQIMERVRVLERNDKVLELEERLLELSDEVQKVKSRCEK